MRQVFEIKISAIVKCNRDTFGRPGGTRIGKYARHFVQRNNAPAKPGEQTQIFAECNVIVAKVVVTGDIQRMICEDRNGSHVLKRADSGGIVDPRLPC